MATNFTVQAGDTDSYDLSSDVLDQFKQSLTPEDLNNLKEKDSGAFNIGLVGDRLGSYLRQNKIPLLNRFGNNLNPGPGDEYSHVFPSLRANADVFNYLTGEKSVVYEPGSLGSPTGSKVASGVAPVPTPSPIVKNVIPPGTSPNVGGPTASAGTLDVNRIRPPKIALQPGATGTEVKALQDYLVSQGLLTPEQVATGPGVYGPQTTAAVLALQKKLGIDYSSGPGFFGPKTIAALSGTTPPTSTVEAKTGSKITPPTTSGTTPASGSQTPMQAFTKILNDAGVVANSSSSLEDIVKQLSNVYGIKNVTDEMSKLDEQYAGDVQNINDDPWISEGIRLKKTESLKNKYDLKKSQLVDRLKLEDTIVGRAITLYTAAKNDEQELLKKAIDFQIAELGGGSGATTNIKEYNYAVSQGYTGSFTQYQKDQANLKDTTTGSNPAGLTNTQINEGSARLGTLPDAFKSLNQQVQIWAISPAAKTFFDTVSKMSAINEDDRVKYDDILTSINSSSQPQVVKDQMIRYLDQSAGNLTETKGLSFWDKLVSIIK